MNCCLLTENDKSRPEVSKGPISFSIKAKDTKKPKIEYRTSVIYKQSYEQGQSDEDADEADADEADADEAEDKDTSDVNGGKLNTNKQESVKSSSQEMSEKSADDLNEQMDSIKAAERIGMYMWVGFLDSNVSLTRASSIRYNCIFVKIGQCLACNYMHSFMFECVKECGEN